MTTSGEALKANSNKKKKENVQKLCKYSRTTGACYDFYFFSEYSKNHKGGI